MASVRGQGKTRGKIREGRRRKGKIPGALSFLDEGACKLRRKRRVTVIFQMVAPLQAPEEEVFRSCQQHWEPYWNPLGNQWWHSPTSFQRKCSLELTSLGWPPAVFIPSIGAPHLFTTRTHAPMTSAPPLKSNKAVSFTNRYARYLLVNEATVCLHGCTSLSNVAPPYKCIVMTIFVKRKKWVLFWTSLWL